MTDERFKLLMEDDAAPLTPEEVAEGWHFCPEMDGLLASSQDPDGDCFCSRSCRNRPNPTYVPAPYEATVFFSLPVPMWFLQLPRKRRRHWLRQSVRAFVKRIPCPNPVPRTALPGYEYMGELEWHYAMDR